jgi:hypothetical protein
MHEEGGTGLGCEIADVNVWWGGKRCGIGMRTSDRGGREQEDVRVV